MTKIWADSREKRGGDSDESRRFGCSGYLSVTLMCPIAPRSISANW